MAGPTEGPTTARETVRRFAVEVLADVPEGLRYSEIERRIRARFPDMKPNTVTGSLWAFTQDLPPEVVKPSRGHYRHAKFGATSDAEAGGDLAPSLAGTKTPQAPTARPKESVFYRPFADWLVNELEECTRAIPLGGSVFRDKWGTPDVLGVREARKSDIVKFPTEIIAAEVKVDGAELITAFGQACAYRLFSHKAYLVVPTSSSEEDVARLDVLARLFGIGLILFDASSPSEPRFAIRVRASKNEPDPFYANKCLKVVERELFE